MLTTMQNNIGIMIYGYKAKNLSTMVKKLKEATKSQNTIYVFDQHPIKHEEEFKDIPDCDYQHKFWDDMHGPAYRRAEQVSEYGTGHTHICIISPDITLAPEWDTILIDLLEKKDVVFSGSGKISVSQKDLFSLSPEYSEDKVFNTTQFIDRNFIFAKKETFDKIAMPNFLKYAGENEYLSLTLLSAGYDIMSIPSTLYTDNHARAIENTYHTFSLEHQYNTVVDLLWGKNLAQHRCTKDGLNKFLTFHKLELKQVKRLPYTNDDVAYDPYDLKIHTLDAIKFLSGVKAVY